MILLCLMAKKEMYGYEILTELNKRAEIIGHAKEGTVYPILYRLEESGLIACRIAKSEANGGSKKYYSLTESGRKTLAELIEFWKSYAACVDDFIEN